MLGNGSKDLCQHGLCNSIFAYTSGRLQVLEKDRATHVIRAVVYTPTKGHGQANAGLQGERGKGGSHLMTTWLVRHCLLHGGTFYELWVLSWCCCASGTSSHTSVEVSARSLLESPHLAASSGISSPHTSL